MKIYTRTGDKGTTGLFGGKRVSKDSLRIEAIGAIDELNSAIGVVIAEMGTYSSSGAKRSREVSSRQARTIQGELTKVQGDLFEIGAMMAMPAVKNKELRTKHLEQRTIAFEALIDKLTSDLPELRNFILPGGSKEGAILHLARSISRRAERRIVALSHKEEVESQILIYMNRLSDLLFTMARFLNKQNKALETPWKGLK